MGMLEVTSRNVHSKLLLKAEVSLTLAQAFV